MLSIHQHLVQPNTPPMDALLISNDAYEGEIPSSLSLLSAFVTRIATPELNADERMQAFNELMQTLNQTIWTQ